MLRPFHNLESRLASLVLDFLYLFSLPFLFIYLAVVSRGFTRQKYRRGLAGKLWGFPRRRGDRPAFWVHAVSVGEVLIAEPLVRALAERFPGWDVVISVSTYTGLEVARKRFPHRQTFYFPVDLGPVVSLAFSRLRPAVVILVELELWPNFLLVSRRRKVPVFVVNGRMTERSARSYRRLGGIGRRLFRGVSAFAVQNEEYAGRFREAGAPAERLAVLGNMKYDRRASVSPETAGEVRSLVGWSPSDVVLTAGCTHPGEESLICGLLSRLRELEPRLRLVLAPRHIERLVTGEVEGWGCPLPVRRWSELREGSPGDGDHVVLVDTVGELERLYAASDVVVVGGSFVPHGGHNMLEPARLGKPAVFGPYHENFRDEARHLLEDGAAFCARDPEDLERVLRVLLEDSERARRVGAAARGSCARLEGAVARHVDWLEGELRLLLPEKS